MINIYSLIQKSIELRLLLSNSSGRVLTFHQVDDKQKWQFKNVSITYGSFKSLIMALIKKGHNFISLQDIATANQLTSKSIALTFDDGYASLNDILAQYLIDQNIPFAIFAAIDLLNKPMYLTNKQLKTLSENSLCTVGAHSVSHPLLRKLNDVNSKNEIINSKSILKEIITKEVEYFAYPYGSVYAVSKRDINYAKETGFKLAFSAINGCLSKKSLQEKWFIPRINVNEDNCNTIAG
jgi:peptidoglycan/xylan/chitin deacetylase (PgdA/CDA1 family)